MARAPKLITVIPADEATPITAAQAVDDLDTLRKTVGGSIQQVPHFNQYGHRVCEAWCNEDGVGLKLPFNKRATDLWLAILGDGPFVYQPRIFGDVAIVQRAGAADG